MPTVMCVGKQLHASCARELRRSKPNHAYEHCDPEPVAVVFLASVALYLRRALSGDGSASLHAAMLKVRQTPSIEGLRGENPKPLLCETLVSAASLMLPLLCNRQLHVTCVCYM